MQILVNDHKRERHQFLELHTASRDGPNPSGALPQDSSGVGSQDFVLSHPNFEKMHNSKLLARQSRKPFLEVFAVYLQGCRGCYSL